MPGHLKSGEPVLRGCDHPPMRKAEALAAAEMLGDTRSGRARRAEGDGACPSRIEGAAVALEAAAVSSRRSPGSKRG
jgi:hypothetical protein